MRFGILFQLRRLALPALFAVATMTTASTSAFPFKSPTLTWTTPTQEPSRNTAGAPIVGGGMPIGNGKTTALVFPLVPGFVNESTFEGSNFTLVPDSVTFVVSSSAAMASDTSLFALGTVSISVPGLFGGKTFEQTLNTSDASVTVKTSTATVRVWVPAQSDVVRASVVSVASGGVPLTVTVQSLRPSKRFEYGGQFLVSGNSVSDPDDWDSVSAAGANASEAARVVLSHRNRVTDVPSSAFNETLMQQGLSQATIDKLSAVGSDQWKDRQFGISVSGFAAAGGGGSLSSSSPSPLFSCHPPPFSS